MSLILKSSQDGTKAIVGIDGGEQFQISSTGDLEIAGKIKSQSGAALTSDSPMVVDVNSSQPALRVTQTGSGNAIVVEDSTNQDATPFAVDSTGRTTIGTLNTNYLANNYKLACVAESTEVPATFLRFGGTSTGIDVRHARGTSASPSATNVGDRFTYLVGSTYGTTGFANPAAMNFYAAENQTDATRGSYITFDTTPVGAPGRSEVMRIGPGQDVTIGGNSVITTETYRGGFKNLVFNGDLSVNQIGGNLPTVMSTQDGPVIFTVDGFGSCAAWRPQGHTQTAFGPVSAVVQRLEDAPPGFRYSLAYTVLSNRTQAFSGEGDGYWTGYQINSDPTVLDLLRTRTITTSFWVKSSIAGKYSALYRRSRTPLTTPVVQEATRTFIRTFTINQPNVWEYKTIVIPADTDIDLPGTTLGFQFKFDLGSGSIWNCPPEQENAWGTGLYIPNSGYVYPNNAGYYRTADSVNLIDTLGARFQFTGLQLELGDKATTFEFLPYADQLLRCQRQYQKSFDDATVMETSAAKNHRGAISTTAADLRTTVPLPVRMDAAPAVTLYAPLCADTFLGRNTVHYRYDYSEPLAFLDPQAPLVAEVNNRSFTMFGPVSADDYRGAVRFQFVATTVPVKYPTV